MSIPPAGGVIAVQRTKVTFGSDADTIASVCVCEDYKFLAGFEIYGLFSFSVVNKRHKDLYSSLVGCNTMWPVGGADATNSEEPTAAMFAVGG
jgi:hypothetical protein